MVNYLKEIMTKTLICDTDTRRRTKFVVLFNYVKWSRCRQNNIKLDLRENSVKMGKDKKNVEEF